MLNYAPASVENKTGLNLFGGPFLLLLVSHLRLSHFKDLKVVVTVNLILELHQE